MNIDWNIINDFARQYYSLKEDDRDQFITDMYESLNTNEQKEQFIEDIKLFPYAWSIFAREKQQLFNRVLEGWKTIAFVGGRGAGKLNDITIPILTDKGWKRFGDLEITDKVYSVDGELTKINWKSEIQYPKCYKLTFDDGSTIIAGENHLWTVWTKSLRKSLDRNKNKDIKPIVVETKDMFKDFIYSTRWSDRDQCFNNEYNYSIELTKPIKLEKKDLLIHPYVLGAWLGDGNTRSGGFTSENEEIPNIIRSFGYDVKTSKTKMRFNIKGLHSQLNILDLKGNKHIPEDYLYSSVEDRLLLLQGLMDTDGTISASGKCCFDNTNLNLVEGVKWLLASLGIPSGRIQTKKTHYKKNGVKIVCQDCYRVNFVCELDVFKLERKKNRINKSNYRRNHKSIKNIEECETVACMCIEIDNPSHLYLLGRELTPTHNSLSASLFIRDLIYNNTVDVKDDILVFGPTAHDVKRIMFDGSSGILNVFPPQHKPQINSKNVITFHNGNKAYMLTSQDASKARGSNAAVIILDEIVAYEANQLEELYMNARASLRKEPGITVITTTPKSSGAYGQFFKELILQSKDPENKTLIIQSSSRENADNLIDLEMRYKQYEGTTALREEYEAEIILDSIQQLFDDKTIYKYCYESLADRLNEIVISLDPAVSEGAKSDDTGIVVCGISKKDGGFESYVIEDKSGSHTPAIMSNIVLDLWYNYNIKYKIPTKILYEANQGGLYIGNQILVSAKNKGLDINLIQPNLISTHVSNNKYDRAYPVSQLMRDGKIHINKKNIELIKQLDNFTGFSNKHKADDRVDAMCAGINYLCFDKKESYQQRNLDNLPRR